jgi:preprotein translocase subunit Sss1
MDLSSLFAGVDNLFKFLFIGGLVMLMTSMFYPLQKEQELEIEINNYNQEVKLLNRDLGELKTDINNLNISAVKVESHLKSLAKLHSRNKSKDASITLEIKGIKDGFKNSYDTLYKKKQTTEIKEILLEFNKSKITLLRKYANAYDDYAEKLKYWGIGFMAIGLIGWVISTVNVERLKIKELRKP